MRRRGREVILVATVTPDMLFRRIAEPGVHSIQSQAKMHGRPPGWRERCTSLAVRKMLEASETVAVRAMA